MDGGRRIGRAISSFLAVAVVVATVYAAGALLSPIPPLEVEEHALDTTALGAGVSAIALPEQGASAVALPSGEPLTAGSAEPRPIAGIAKLVLAHVVVAEADLEGGRTGTTITIDQDDLQRYRALQASGIRTVSVSLTQSWTMRDLLIATLIGSGNNTAELLAEAVFGDKDAYLAAAAAWLADNDMPDTVVVDATGLNGGSVATARDLAVLAQLTIAQPVLSELLRERPIRAGGVGFDDNAAFARDLGVIGATNTYTDAAGVCLVLLVPVGDTLVGAAIIGLPSYAAANAAVDALVPSLQESIRPLTVVEVGDVVGEFHSDWGRTVDLLAAEAATVLALDLSTVSTRLVIDDRRTVLRGSTVGRLVVETPDGEKSVRVEAAGTIPEPGIGWRFADPFTVLGRWID